jgi:hypothetical protein
VDQHAVLIVCAPKRQLAAQSQLEIRDEVVQRTIILFLGPSDRSEKVMEIRRPGERKLQFSALLVIPFGGGSKLLGVKLVML